MPEDNLSKAELALIDKIIVAVGLDKFRNSLWQKVHQAFGFSFHGTNIEYGFARATPDERALAYLNDRIFILSDKTQAKLVGDLRWELLEGMRNAENIDEIKRRLDTIFEGNTVNTERIARTEVLNAMNAGRHQAHVESGIAKYKQWRAAINNPRTAADSKWLHGQIQEIENPFVYKNGDSFMHPPNRPNCRCTTLFLRKLPENIVYKGGQMYAADEMVGKIEIDLAKLERGLREGRVKVTRSGKTFWRKQRVGQKDVEIEEKSAIKRIEAIIPNVKLEGATEEQLNSIAEGIEETIGKYPAAGLHSIGWSTEDDEHIYGMPDAAYIPKSRSNPYPRIIVRKEVVASVTSWANKAEKKFVVRKEINIDYCNDMIKGYTNWNELDQVAIYEKQLKEINACSRLFVALSVKDKLKSIIIHEGYHAIDVQMHGEGIFLEQLKKFGVTKVDQMMVSDYAASKETELWAEVGSAVCQNVTIPDSIRKAFDATMEAIR